jgi:uncharacterized protein (TIGR01777 family)
MLGASLSHRLESEGHEVVRLVRPESRATPTAVPGKMVRWDTSSDHFDEPQAEVMDALVHLAGASIADERWNDARRDLLRSSRGNATHNLIATLSRLKRPPGVIVSASAIGYDGNQGEEELTESSAPGNEFLSEVCREWEQEALRGVDWGARIVILRFGIILAEKSGALPKMLLPFKSGLGGKLGSGRQWMSWLALDEAINMVRFALSNSALIGPANAVAPQPVRNADFTRALAKALHRPAIFPVPGFALRLAVGEMADALLPASERVIPTKLTACGVVFPFAIPTSICRSNVTICSALYLLFGISSQPPHKRFSLTSAGAKIPVHVNVSLRMLSHYSNVRLAAKRTALELLSRNAVQQSNGQGTTESHATKYGTNPVRPPVPNAQVVEKYGRPVRTRTADLYRVKVAL